MLNNNNNPYMQKGILSKNKASVNVLACIPPKWGPGFTVKQIVTVYSSLYTHFSGMDP